VTMEVRSPMEQMLFTTSRLVTEKASGEGGVGTSFLFNYVSGQDSYPFLVTNRHMVEGTAKGRLTFTKAANGKPLIGTGHVLDIEDFQRIWYGHPDPELDVAVAPFAPILRHMSDDGTSIFFRAVGGDMLPSVDVLKELDALEEVVFIGYPSGIWDSRNLLPIIRKGTTATPVVVDFQGKPQFLVDASVFPGSSGSPVFLYNVGTYRRKRGDVVVGNRIFFLGIMASVFYREDTNEIRARPSPTTRGALAVSRQMIDLGVVYKASAITELIESVVRERG